MKKAGRPKMPDKKVFYGGRMKPNLIEWAKNNGGFSTVEKAVELYKNQIEDKTMRNTLQITTVSDTALKGDIKDLAILCALRAKLSTYIDDRMYLSSNSFNYSEIGSDIFDKGVQADSLLFTAVFSTDDDGVKSLLCTVQADALRSTHFNITADGTIKKEHDGIGIDLKLLSFLTWYESSFELVEE
jgi:hypothetical protein